jgi:probable F420-dependent oxidoreductase
MPNLPSVGLNVSALQLDHLLEFTVEAERLGYESVWYGEHVAIPAGDGWWRDFPGAQFNPDFTEEMVPFTLETGWLDPMVVLGHLAAVTSRVRLGVGIYMLALRDAVLAGRTLTSVDFLSGGRLDVAVGLGWSRDEYAVTGNRWETRGRRTDELIRVLRTLFEQHRPEFHGEFFDFPPISFEPKPVQQPLPIHVGGGGPAAFRRAAALGNGWYGGPDAIPEIRRLLEEHGRGDQPFQFSVITMQGGIPVEDLERLAALGVDRVIVTPWAGTKSGTVGRDGLAQLGAYALEVGLG